MGKSFKEFFKGFKQWLNRKIMVESKESDDPINRKYIKYIRNRLLFIVGGILIIAVIPLLLYLMGFPADEELATLFLVVGVLFLGVMVIDLFIIALYYVSEDSKRRMMSPTLWVIVCLFVPYLLGFVLYFLIRRPIPLSCPNCKSFIPNGSKHCHNCGFQIRASCPKCGAPVPENANFCPQCGVSLKS